MEEKSLFLNGIAFRNLNVWGETLNKAFRPRRNFSYKVLYTDGTMSWAKSAKDGRQPFGIIVQQHCLLINAPEIKTSFLKGMELLNDFQISGVTAQMPSQRYLEIINENFEIINELIHELGGTPLSKGYYLSGISDDDQCVLVELGCEHIENRSVTAMAGLSVEEFYICPIFRIYDLLALI